MLGELSFSVQNIVDNQGISIAATGLLIVFTSLALITCALAAMPKILAALEPYLPAEQDHTKTATNRSSGDEAIAVAIGYALHTQSSSKDKTD